MHDIIVVGGGPAGMTAALYALRNNKSVLVIEKGGAGAVLASTAVNILNAYFTPDEISTAIIGEHQLMR